MNKLLLAGLASAIVALPALAALNKGDAAPAFKAQASLAGKEFSYSLADALKMMERGYNFVTILGDIRLMAWSAKTIFLLSGDQYGAYRNPGPSFVTCRSLPPPVSRKRGAR